VKISTINNLGKFQTVTQKLGKRFSQCVRQRRGGRKAKGSRAVKNKPGAEKAAAEENCKIPSRFVGSGGGIRKGGKGPFGGSVRKNKPERQAE